MSPTQLPLYVWQYSEDWVRAKRVIEYVDEKPKPLYHEIQNPETGLFAAVPVYVKQKVCLELNHQWVMSRWMNSGSFDEWRKLYEDNLEWPKAGEYMPVTAFRASTPNNLICLNPAEEPTEEITWEFIRVVRRDRAEVDKINEDLVRQSVSRKKSEYDKIAGEFRNLLPTFLNIPGSRSFPIWPGIGHKVDDRTSFEKITE